MVKHWLLAAGTEVLWLVPRTDQALDLIEDDGNTAYPVADKLAAMGVPHLFATGDVKVADAAVYRHRPRLEKPFVEPALIAGLVKLLT